MKNRQSQLRRIFRKALPRWLLNRPTDNTSHQQTGSANSSFELCVSYLPEIDVVKIVAQGDLSIKSNNQIVAAALHASRTYGTNRILVDDRNANVSMSLQRLLDLQGHNISLGLSKDLRVALIFSDIPTNGRIFRIYENLSVLSDMPHRVFSTEEAAITWLCTDGRPLSP